MYRSKLVMRIKQHYIMEFINVFLFPICFLIISKLINRPIGQNSIVAMILNGVILLEGSYFWFMIYTRLVSHNTDKQTRVVSIYRKLKILNIALFVLAIFHFMTNTFYGFFDIVVTVIFLILAILEHINYFEIQLMYDSYNDKMYFKRYRKLKVSKLKAIMDRLNKV